MEIASSQSRKQVLRCPLRRTGGIHALKVGHSQHRSIENWGWMTERYCNQKCSAYSPVVRRDGVS
jgi:hypothetical protein